MIESVRLSHLKQLEAESIHIIREVAAEFRNPLDAVTDWVGKEPSGAMVRLAQKGLPPGAAPVPPPARRHHLGVLGDVRVPGPLREGEQAGAAGPPRTRRPWPRGINPFDYAAETKHTTVMKTHGLLQALALGGFDAAFGGARRDEEKSLGQGAGLRRPPRAVGPQEPAPRAVEPLQRARIDREESIRVFPLSNWTELDVWQYLWLERFRWSRCTSRPSGR